MTFALLSMATNLRLHKAAFLLFLSINLAGFVMGDSEGFTYNGFRRINMTLDGVAVIEPNGLLQMTNISRKRVGHAFYPNPLEFKNTTDGDAFSFSTAFVFAIVPEYSDLGGHGLAFTISPSKQLHAFYSQYLGLFNDTNGNFSNHVFAVEMDTVLSAEFGDIDDNHVGIDINSLRSNASAHSAYYSTDTKAKQNLSLDGRELIQMWVEYDGVEKLINVTVSPLNISKPHRPLLSYHVDLSPILLKSMYVGFSAATGSLASSHYVLGWSFQMNGQTKPLDLSRLPSLPRRRQKRISKGLTVEISLSALVFVLTSISGIVYMVRKRKYAEILEDWELEYGPHRFSYKDLFSATKGFKEKELLGTGGFGRVYKGVLPATKNEVAVKRVSHESTQGLKEFVAEIASLGRLRHRNLVPLLGYCRRKRELLLVYDFMPNGSLDKLIFDQTKPILNWAGRFKIIRGVACGLLYLHEEWEQIVVHRDVKASNVLLDSDLNGRLGDFGLARLYDHGTNPQTTHVVGTLGYLAPELARSGKATTSSDVFAFGALMLEVACGRRPIEPRSTSEELILVDWVLDCWNRGMILESSDPKLGGNYVAEEMELVLKLGLLCSHPMFTSRPSMRQVMQFLDRDGSLPDISPEVLISSGFTVRMGEGFDDFIHSYGSSLEKTPTTDSTKGSEAFLSTGR